MSPEERQLLNGLFDRTRTAAATPRDPEAEALISDQVKAQPYAPYLLAQAVIVQEQALRAANDKLQELQARVEEFEQQQQGRGQQPPAGGGFLSGIGSLFGAGSPPPPPPQRGPAPGGPGPWGQQPPQQGFGQQNYAPPPPQQQQSPWGANAPQGGSFLKGALGAAAGVAGGVLLADGIRNLFGGHNNPYGIGGLNPGMGGGETVVNNYYESDNPGASQADFVGNDDGNDVDDASYDDDDSGPDDSYDV